MVLRSLDSEEFHVDVKKKDKADGWLFSLKAHFSSEMNNFSS
jgi:hypothetical protein